MSPTEKVVEFCSFAGGWNGREAKPWTCSRVASVAELAAQCGPAGLTCRPICACFVSDLCGELRDRVEFRVVRWCLSGCAGQFKVRFAAHSLERHAIQIRLLCHS
eukprot:3968064-Amphidinium_carterae.1